MKRSRYILFFVFLIISSLLHSKNIFAQMSCTPRCEGTLIHSANCTVRDCAADNTTCIADPTPHCSTVGCPPTGSGQICLDERYFLICNDGVSLDSPIDCHQFGSFCSTAGVGPLEARCVLSLCFSSTELLYDHTVCSVNAGEVIYCSADNTYEFVDCPPGLVCSVQGGATQCVTPINGCPISEAPNVIDQEVCLDNGSIGRCYNGNILEERFCDPQQTCMNIGGMPRCKDRDCIDEQGQINNGPRCLSVQERVVCERGLVTERLNCEAGSLCKEEMGSAQCQDIEVVDPEADMGLSTEYEGGRYGFFQPEDEDSTDTAGNSDQDGRPSPQTTVLDEGEMEEVSQTRFASCSVQQRVPSFLIFVGIVLGFYRRQILILDQTHRN